MVQLLPALEAGGVERSTLEVAQALVDAGQRAIVVSAGGRLVERLEAMGAEHVSLDIGRKSPWTLRHVAGLRRVFMRERPDIVHARSRLPAWLGWWALRSMRTPRPHWVTTVHGLNSPGRYSRILTSGERVICVSDTVRDYVLRHYPGLDDARLRVVPRGIDPAVWDPARVDPDSCEALLQRHPALRGGPVLLMPGRGTRLKGHADALALLAGLHQAGVPARLWLLGAADTGRAGYLDQLQAQARQLGVEHAVLISEAVQDVRAAYRLSSLVLQLSRKPEAFGRTVVEAIAMGRAVLGWDHGGVGESLASLYPAGRVPLGDLHGLIEAARVLLQEPVERPRRLSTTLRAMQDATLAIYDELTGC